MNILVTGANGQLGSEMRVLAASSSNRYIFSDIASIDGRETTILDITDIEAVKHLCKDSSVDVIVNCAAYTNVDKAEDDYATAYKINAEAVSNLAKAATECGALLVHVSTDYVFNGTSCIPYTEDLPVEPIGAYGKTKAEGERFVFESGCRYLIFRTAWLYSVYGNNFVKTMRRLTSERDSLKVVFDQVGSPTYAADLAFAIFSIIEDGKSAGKEGVYHFSNEGVCSWFDFSKAIAELSGNLSCNIQPCHSDEFPSKVKRPHYSVLDKTKYKEAFGISVPHWYDALKRCVLLLNNQ
jgi:dTDP-4-dehydrorhamnose reductase